MSPVLDATEIETEDELTQEQEQQEQQEAADAAAEQETAAETPPVVAFDPIRSITLALPADCETAVTLMVQRGDDCYRSGFRIRRDYETSPHEQSGEDLLPTDPAADERCKILGEAVAVAAEMAAEWLQFHSDDADERAQAALTWLDNWDGKFNPVAITGDIFDDAPIAVAEEGEADAGCEATVKPAVTDEAQRHYDDRKHELEERLGKLSIEQVRLKAAVKCNREAMNTVTGELEDHLARGVVRLPLFDRAVPTERESVEKIADDLGCPIAISAVSADESALDESAESWRSATIEEIGIEPKICQLLRDNNQIETLGQIADHCKDYELTDLKKIGAAKAKKIEEAMDAYWLAHPLAEVVEEKPEAATESEETK